MPRANLFDNNKKIIISLNYKCASSNIIRWFISNMENYKHENTVLSNTINRKYVFSDGKINKFKDYYKILIVRNPFNRVISAFLDKAFFGFVPLQNLCKTHKVLFQNLTFRKFIQMIEKGRMSTMNGHWRPLMYENKPEQYDKIIKMEFLGNHMNVFAKRFGYTIFPIKKKMLKKRSKNLCDVPIKELKLMNPDIYKNYRNYLDKEIVCIIERIYKNDLKIFNYSYKSFLKNT